MSDRVDSSPAPTPNPFLRQTFAWRFQQPEDLAALTRVLQRLEEWAMETGQFGPENRVDCLAAAIEAAGLDALFLAAFLEELARERFASALTEEQSRQCERAERWAEQMRGLGEAILGRSGER